MSDFDFVFAVGDVHGELRKLLALNDQMSDLAEELPGRKLAVYLGDYIDRGPSSRQVVDEIQRQQSEGLRGFDDTLPIKGNHEEFMVVSVEEDLETIQEIAASGTPVVVEDVFFDPRFRKLHTMKHSWLVNGGIETLASYAISDSPSEILVGHAEWMRNLPASHREGDFFFVHAGIAPGRPLNEQHQKDLLWIRHEFLGSREDHGVRVVHGHTPADRPQIYENRIGIDTAACFGGKLTCAVLDMSKPIDQEPRILQA